MKIELKLGQYLQGSEPTGCFNSGVAPVIARSKRSKKYTGKEYIVGRDIDVLCDLTGVILKEIKGEKQKPKFFASKAAAVKLFEKMETAMRESNQADALRINELKAKARQGDMSATLALSDYA